MIFLIDDKKKRQQEDFGWNSERFEKYSTAIKPIYTSIELYEQWNEISTQKHIILYHESFLDNTNNAKKAVDFRTTLEKTAAGNAEVNLVFFSGGIRSREINKNVALVPVSTLYKNLETYCQRVLENKSDIKFLLFGANPEIEELLNREQIIKLEKITVSKAKIPNASIHLIRPKAKLLRGGIENATESIQFSDVSDQKLTQNVISWLGKVQHDYIYLPLCFGPFNADYNGLRLATHIRCTTTINQNTPIFIYGVVGLEWIIHHKYFNILKTKNVHLIGIDNHEIEKAPSLIKSPLEKNELFNEIEKLKLDIPLDYNDNHSIQNEWAMYQWSKNLNFELTDELEDLFENVESNLYFKYLKTIHPPSSYNREHLPQQKDTSIDKPRILLVDDEEDKGWYEIVCNLFEEKAHVYSIGEGFRTKTSNEIVDLTIETIQADEIDVVLLDFRLNDDDFNQLETSKITSIQLIQAIKKINPGIQVIIFSATNKVWNLQALQDFGADSFVYKDSGKTVNQAIESLVSQVNSATDKAIWLKPIFEETQICISHLQTQRKEHVLDKDLTGAVTLYLQMAFDSVLNITPRTGYDSAFTYYFLVLESLSSAIIDTEGIKQPDGQYKFQFRKNTNYLKSFNKDTGAKSNYELITSSNRVPHGQKLFNLIDYCGLSDTSPLKLVPLRNNFIHPNLVANTDIAKIQKTDLNSIFEVCITLIQTL